MDKWEYKTVYGTSASGLATSLNTEGQAGWEAVNMTAQAHGGTPSSTYYALLKRKIR